MRNLLTNNKGFVMVSAYLIIILLIIWGSAFFLLSLEENNLAKRNQNSLDALYAAREGISCVNYELRSHTIWFTHTIVGNTIIPEDNPAFTPTANLQNLARIADANDPDCPSCYVSIENVPGTTTPKFMAKIYIDPETPATTPAMIVLSRGNSKNSSRLFVARIQPNSLFDHFLFFPDNFYMGAKTWRADGGKMYVGGDVIWKGGSKIYDLTELNTPQAFRYYANPVLPPDPGEFGYPSDPSDPLHYGPCHFCGAGGGGGCSAQCNHDPNNPLTWADLNPTMRAPYGFFKPDGTFVQFNPSYGIGPSQKTSYLNFPDGNLSADNNFDYRLRMNSPVGGRVVEWNGTCIDPQCSNLITPFNPTNLSLYRDSANLTQFEISGGSALKANIPNRLASSYQVGKYEYVEDKYNFTFNFNDNIPVNYLNSLQQSAAWNTYLTNSGLQGILKDGRSGAMEELPKTIYPELYRQSAQEEGVFITVSAEDSKVHVHINGMDNDYTEDADGKIIINNGGQDVLVAEKKKYFNPNSGWTHPVLVLHLDVLNNAGAYATNGMFYTEGIDLAVDNAPRLPRSTTFAVEENLILKGNFNFVNGYPLDDFPLAAAILRKEVFTVSDQFTFYNSGDPDNSMWKAELRHPSFPYSNSGQEQAWYNAYHDSMPSIVTDSYLYNISLVGQYGYVPGVMEQWQNATRVVAGSFVKLLDVWYIDPTLIDGIRTRYCDNDLLRPSGAACRSSLFYPAPWPSGMTSTTPPRDNNTYELNPVYIDTSAADLPPGNKWCYAQDVSFEIADTGTNFSQTFPQLHHGG